MGILPHIKKSSHPGEGNGNPLQYSWLENPMDEEPGGLKSTGSQRVRHDWLTSLSLSFTHPSKLKCSNPPIISTLVSIFKINIKKKKKENLSEPHTPPPAPPRVTTEESGLIVTLLPTHPAPSPPQQPRGEDCLLCSGLPASFLGDVSAPAPHGLTSAPLTDPVLQALLQGSSKSPVTLSCRRLRAEFTSSQRDPCNPRVQRGQPGSWLRVERPIFQMKAEEAETHCVCVRRGGEGGLDQV